MLLSNDVAQQLTRLDATVVDTVGARPPYFVEELISWAPMGTVDQQEVAPSRGGATMAPSARALSASPLVMISSFSGATPRLAFPRYKTEASTEAGVTPTTDHFANTKLISPLLRRSLDTQAAALKALSDNWDGEGALAVPGDRVDTLKAELEVLLRGYVGPLVDLAPGSDGSLQAEWRLPGGIQIYYGIDSVGEIFFQRSGDDESMQVHDRAARKSLLDALAKYFGTKGTATLVA